MWSMHALVVRLSTTRAQIITGFTDLEQTKSSPRPSGSAIAFRSYADSTQVFSLIVEPVDGYGPIGPNLRYTTDTASGVRHFGQCALVVASPVRLRKFGQRRSWRLAEFSGTRYQAAFAALRLRLRRAFLTQTAIIISTFAPSKGLYRKLVIPTKRALR